MENQWHKTALRFLIQRGVIVIPKSTHKERMIQNMEVFDFVLTEEDMQAIAGLDKAKKSVLLALRPGDGEMAD